MREIHVGKSRYIIANISSGKYTFDIGTHSHGNGSYEIHYCFSGKGELITDGKTYPLTRNSLYITGPGVNHSHKNDSENPIDEICLYIRKTFTGSDTLSSNFNATHFWAGKADKDTEYLFYQLDKASKQTSLYAREMQIHLSELIVTRLSFIYSPELVMAKADTPDDKKYVIIENAFIFDFPKLTLTELAKRLSLSERQTQRVVRQYYGISFREKLQHVRLERAEELLRQGEGTTRTAFAVGYADAPSFIRAFRKKYGILPSDIK